MMRNPFNEIMQKLRAQRVRARRYTAMLLVLAMLTSLSVSWRLHPHRRSSPLRLSRPPGRLTRTAPRLSR